MSMGLTCYRDRDETLLGLGFSSYAAYLGSDLWKGIRANVFSDLGRDCFRCGKRATVLHHTSYAAAVLAGEDTSKIIPLCTECHEQIEFDREHRKRSLAEANQLLGWCSPKRKRTREVRTIIAGHQKIKRHRDHVAAPGFARANHRVMTEGQECQKCGEPVVKKFVTRKPKAKQTYAFHWYLYCKKCKTMYIVEAAKYTIANEPQPERVRDQRLSWCACGNLRKRTAPMCKACLKKIHGP